MTRPQNVLTFRTYIEKKKQFYHPSLIKITVATKKQTNKQINKQIQKFQKKCKKQNFGMVFSFKKSINQTTKNQNYL